MIKRKFIQLACTALFCLAFGLSASAQIVLVDNMGNPIHAKHYLDVQGSPFLYEKWTPGLVKLTNGKYYDKVDLMYDQVEDRLIFRNNEGQAQLFADPVLEFTIAGRVFRKGYKPVDGAAPMAFYEVLVEGPAQLLKRTTKKVFEETPYGSSTRVKTIQENNAYYISKQETALVKVKKDKKSVLGALNSKKSELENYIKTNRLDLKQEEDMAKLVAYYNTLK